MDTLEQVKPGPRQGSKPTLGDVLYADDTLSLESEKTWAELVRRVAAHDAQALHSLGEFGQAPITPGDTDALVSGTYDFYEKVGDTVIRWLADEPRISAMREHLNIGRQHLRAWVAEAFAPQLNQLRGNARKELHDALIVAFDVYTWKLLRRDFGLSRRAAEAGGLGRVDDGAAAWTVDEAPGTAVVALNAGQFTGASSWGWVVTQGRELRPPGRGPLAVAMAWDNSRNS